MGKIIRWDEEKNQLLQLQRDVGFEDVLEKIANGDILGRRLHPNTDKYPNQQIFVLEINNYIWYVPFVETTDEIFLKTIIPSRKLTKEFGGKTNEK
jgi:uncharacterized DUF497 family protein